jgi:predicted ABC-class ATPase
MIYLLNGLAFLLVQRPIVCGRSCRLLMSSYQGRGGGRGGGGGGGRGGGRGEYYKNKYGGGGKGRGKGQGNEPESESHKRTATGGGSFRDLQRLLEQLDNKSYSAYHDLDTPMDLSRGWVNNDLGFTLFVERAQSDPFAPPTRCRVVLSASKAQFPPQLYSNKIRSIALGDYLQRALHANCVNLGADASLGGTGWSGPKGGDLQVLAPCQHILEQSAVRIDSAGNVTAQITISLPARGRTILGREAAEILGKTLATMVHKSLNYASLNAAKLQQHVESVEDQRWLQDQLESRNLVAFVRNGAILPRLSGVDDRPMAGSSNSPVVSFESPPRLEVSFTLPHAGTKISGMGVPKGITLICGGGFHGKSTLLDTLQVGIYPKIPGDGREFCVTSPKACKIRAEDGRAVQAVDISPFINNLPFGKDTSCFDTPDASGSTSQAANIIEVSATRALFVLNRFLGRLWNDY